MPLAEVRLRRNPIAMGVFEVDNIIDFKGIDPRPYAVSVTVLTAQCPDATVRLKRGEELFVVTEGRPIQRPGHRGPDEVFAMGEGICGGNWPVMLVRVRHPEAWAELDAATANRMIARCRKRLIDEGLAPLPLTPTSGEGGGT